jgi:hypothetical protein
MRFFVAENMLIPSAHPGIFGSAEALLRMMLIHKGAIHELPLITSRDTSLELGTILAPIISRTDVRPCSLSDLVLRYL